MKKRKPPLRVPGHTIMFKAAPCNNVGQPLPLFRTFNVSHGSGYAFCSCGQGSRWEYGTVQERRDWHHDHKLSQLPTNLFNEYCDRVDRFNHP